MKVIELTIGEIKEGMQKIAFPCTIVSKSENDLTAIASDSLNEIILSIPKDVFGLIQEKRFYRVVGEPIQGNNFIYVLVSFIQSLEGITFLEYKNLISLESKIFNQ